MNRHLHHSRKRQFFVFDDLIPCIRLRTFNVVIGSEIVIFFCLEPDFDPPGQNCIICIYNNNRWFTFFYYKWHKKYITNSSQFKFINVSFKKCCAAGSKFNSVSEHDLSNAIQRSEQNCVRIHHTDFTEVLQVCEILLAIYLNLLLFTSS